MNIALGSHLTLEQKVRVGENNQNVKISEERPFQPVRNVGQLRPSGGYNKVAGRNKMGAQDPNYRPVPLQPLKGSELPKPESSYEVERRIKLRPVISNAKKMECDSVQIRGVDLEFGTVQSNVNGHKTLTIMKPHGADMSCDGAPTARKEAAASTEDITQADLNEAEKSAFGNMKVPAGNSGTAEVLKRGIDTIPKKRGAVTTGNTGKSGYARGGYGAKNTSWNKVV